MRRRALAKILVLAVAGLLIRCDDVSASGDATNAQPGGTSGGAAAGTATPFTLPDTGQVDCYDDSTCGACPTAGQPFHGQDAQLASRAPNFRVNGDGTVTDLVTGLMWQQDPGQKMTLDEAMAGEASFELAGYDDWRLPTIKELYSLIDFSGVDPSGYEGDDTKGLVPFIDTGAFAFEYGDPGQDERIIDSQFATSTLYVSTVFGGMEAMFGVNFADGRIKGYPPGATPKQPTGKTFFVLHVRGATGYGDNDLTDNGDGTVTDDATGLVWQKADSGDGMDWQDALDTCDALTLAGHDDWRLPDAKELQSIVDYTRSPDTTSSAALDPVFTASPTTNEAGQADFAYYWTSTTHANQTTGHDGANAVYIAFGRAMGYMNGAWMDVHGAGAQRSDPKAGDPAEYPTGHGPQGDAIRIYNHVRCVRGGDVQATTGQGAMCAVGGTVDRCPDGDCRPRGGERRPVGDERRPGGERRRPGGRTGGPAACTTDAECTAPGACPPDAALGCACLADPQGASHCAPVCDTNADCPSPPDMVLTCAPDGVCIPEGGPRRRP